MIGQVYLLDINMTGENKNRYQVAAKYIKTSLLTLVMCKNTVLYQNAVYIASHNTIQYCDTSSFLINQVF